MEGGEGSQWAEEDTEQRRSLSGRAEARMPVRLLCYWTWMTLGKAWSCGLQTALLEAGEDVLH